MKKILFFYILIAVVSCAKEKSKTSRQVEEYYKGFKSSNYKQIRRTLSDSITFVVGDNYKENHTPKSFYEKFKWDSVFKPVYKLVGIENQGEQIIATFSVASLRFEFLKNNPLICKHKFYFKSGKISQIEDLNCINANWEVWQKERDSLVKWIKFNHPNLDGFINNLTEKGAKDYLDAIQLYRKDYLNK